MGEGLPAAERLGGVVSDAPKWIAEILEKLPGAVGPIEREALAIEIAENFPVRECMGVALDSLARQFLAEGFSFPIPDVGGTKLQAIAANVVQALAGVIYGPDTEPTRIADEWIEMRTLLGNIGAPWQVEGRTLRIAEQLELLINARRVAK